jgi:hypothetical protein
MANQRNDIGEQVAASMEGQQKGSTTPACDAFDVWLARAIRQSFGAKLSAPVPVDLLELVSQ